jgi:diguanylate cyclase (GGDEF)-like protein
MRIRQNRRSNKQKFFLVTERKSPWKIALRVALIYAVFSLAWIFLSDTAVFFFIRDEALRNQISIFKGFSFVVLSATLIYCLTAPAFSKLSDDEQVILENRNELKALLYYDHLTGLSNRRKLIERLPVFLEDATTKSKALLFIDIDNIKLINDTMGHIFGDTLITETARRLSSCLVSPDEIYRNGGDEFVILTKFASISEINAKVKSILDLFASPVGIEGTLIHSTISMGISLYPLHGTDPGDLLRCADIAMYQSKKNGKNCAVLYNNNMMTPINERMSIGEYLHDALENGELEVYYQPQISIETKTIASFEALIRWNNRILGKVTPDKFISIAEETHLIIPIGEWILKEACAFLKKLHRDGYPNLTISVNISMIQLIQEDFAQTVSRIVAETELDPAKLELEITESVLMESHVVIRKHLDELRTLGIGIALDDFGKGYSSLSYLEQLPITTLKIDKIFIDGIVDSISDTSITGNIVRIGKKLGLTVIAEGVETETQLEYLAFQQCDKIQGWIFSKALGESDAIAYVKENSATPAR